MAKDASGKKFNRIPAHTKVVEGKTIKVKEHIRSNRKDSKGQLIKKQTSLLTKEEMNRNLKYKYE